MTDKHGKRIFSYLEFSPHGGTSNCVTIGRKTHLFATGGQDCKTLVWTVHHLRKTGKPFKSCRGHTSAVTTATFDSSEEQLVSGSEGGELRLWHLNDPKSPKTFSDKHSAAVSAVEFSPDNVFLASGSQDAQVKVWTMGERQCLHTLKHHTKTILAVAFSPDSRWLFTGSEDGTCGVIDVFEGKLMHSFSLNSPVRALAVHPSDLVMATGCENGTVRVWDLSTFELISEIPQEPTSVCGMQFCGNDGKVLLVGTERAVSFWRWDVSVHDSARDYSSPPSSSSPSGLSAQRPKLYDRLDAKWLDAVAPGKKGVVDVIVGDTHLLACSIVEGKVTMWLSHLKEIAPFNRTIKKGSSASQHHSPHTPSSVSSTSSSSPSSSPQPSHSHHSTSPSATVPHQSSAGAQSPAVSSASSPSPPHKTSSSPPSSSVKEEEENSPSLPPAKPSLRALRGQRRIYAESKDSPFYTGPEEAQEEKPRGRGRGMAHGLPSSSAMPAHTPSASSSEAPPPSTPPKSQRHTSSSSITTSPPSPSSHSSPSSPSFVSPSQHLRPSLKSRLGQSIRDPWALKGDIDLDEDDLKEEENLMGDHRQQTGKAGLTGRRSAEAGKRGGEEEDGPTEDGTQEEGEGNGASGDDDDRAAVKDGEDRLSGLLQMHQAEDEKENETTRTKESKGRSGTKGQQPISRSPVTTPSPSNPHSPHAIESAASSGASSQPPQPSIFDIFAPKKVAQPPNSSTSSSPSMSTSSPSSSSSAASAGVVVVDRDPKEAVSSISSRHAQTLLALQQRQKSLQTVKRVWELGDIKRVCDSVVRIDDASVMHDVLSVLIQRKGLFNLDCAITLLPLLIKSLDSPLDTHILTALSSLSLFAKSFGSVIKQTRSAPVSIGVDISAEERRDKCNIANQHFSLAIPALARLIARRRAAGDTVGMRAKDVKTLLDGFVDCF